jgi:hypothetical protein
MSTPEETAVEEQKGGPQGEPPEEQKPPATYESFFEAQPAEVKTLIEEHTQGLKSALESERESRKGLEKQVRDLAGKAEKGSEAEAQLTKLADSLAEAERKSAEGLAEAERRTAFYEAAHAAGISNLKLAYTVALQDEMFDKRGAVNFEALRSSYPELFGGKPSTPPGNAGAGTGSPPVAQTDMNAFIRGSARG